MKNVEKSVATKKMAITIAMVDFENLSNFLCLKSLGQGVFHSSLGTISAAWKKKFTAIIIYNALKIKKIVQKRTNIFLSYKSWELLKNYNFFDNISTYSLV